MEQKALYQITQDAIDDLHAIHACTVTNWGTVQAEKYLRQLQEHFSLLAQSPNLGFVCSDIDENSEFVSRRLACAEHVVYYKVVKKSVVIYAVLHRSMLPGNHLVERDLE